MNIFMHVWQINCITRKRWKDGTGCVRWFLRKVATTAFFISPYNMYIRVPGIFHVLHICTCCIIHVPH